MTITILVLKASVLLAAALAAGRLLGRDTPSARHTLWTATFAALLALPLLALLLPAMEVPLPSRWRPAPAAALGPVPGPVVIDGTAVTRTGGGHAYEPVAGAPPSSLSSPARQAPSITVVLVALWAAGTAIATAMLLVSLLRVRRLATSACGAGPAAWDDRSAALGTRLGLRRHARVVFNAAVRTPMAGGVWRPLIFLPPSAAAWEDERRDIVLAHELSHLARRDPLRHLAVRFALACYWFHPLAWVAARESSLAREQACDEAVLSLGVRPSAYARVLLELADGMAVPRATAALPMVQRSLLERRLMAILDDRSRPASSRPLAVLSAAALLTIAVAAAQPAVQATTTIVSPVPRSPRAVPEAVKPADPQRLHLTGRVEAEAAVPAQATGNDCWADTLTGSFRGNRVTFNDPGGRATVDEMIGTRNGERVVQTHVGDLRVCMVAQGAVGLESSRPSQWSAPRVLIESRRGDGSTQQMDIRGGQTTWRVNGRERALDPAAQEWRAAMFAALDATWELSTLRGEVSTLRGEISTVRGEESTLRGEISTLRGEVSSLRGRQSSIRGDESSLRGEIASIRGEVSSLRGQASSEMGEISSLEARRWDASTAERDQIAARIRDHQAAIARIEKAIADYNESGKIADVERRIRELDADRQAAAIDEEIRRFDVERKVQEVERRIQSLDVNGKVAGIERRIQALDADRRGRALEERRDEAARRLEQAVKAIK